MPSISIALATYNGERYIAAQLDSIRRQSSTPNELIVCDDGSSDNTINLVRDFAENTSFPIRIVQNRTRLGYRANFMQAAAACTSELIAFCDQDDIWASDKLATMRYAFDDPKVLLAYHNATLIDDRGFVLGTTFRQRKQKTFKPLAIYPWLVIPGFAQVVRRSLLRFTPLHAGSIDPYATNEPMPHDHWYPFWASVLGDIAYIPNTSSRVPPARRQRIGLAGALPGLCARPPPQCGTIRFRQRARREEPPRSAAAMRRPAARR